MEVPISELKWSDHTERIQKTKRLSQDAGKQNLQQFSIITRFWDAAAENGLLVGWRRGWAECAHTHAHKRQSKLQLSWNKGSTLENSEKQTMATAMN